MDGHDDYDGVEYAGAARGRGGVGFYGDRTDFNVDGQMIYRDSSKYVLRGPGDFRHSRWDNEMLKRVFDQNSRWLKSDGDVIRIPIKRI